MGAFRKTMSVATLGLVSFRSKKEKLARAERASDLAELELHKEQEARAEADRRVALADERARAAEHVLVREAKSLRSRRWRARAGQEAIEARSRVSSAVDGLVDRAAGSASSAAGSAKKETKRAAKHTKKDLKRAAKHTKKDLKRAAKHTKHDAKRAAKHTTQDAKRATKPLGQKVKSVGRALRRRSKDGANKASDAFDGAVERAEELADR
jgi:colicin import membrane protein